MSTDVIAKAGHDFHVVSLTPSVTLFVDFDGTNGTDPRGSSFYKGRAHVCLKDSIFQPSNAERHAVELLSLMDDVGGIPALVMSMMTNGGADHNCRHLAVQMSWLGVLLISGFDMLVVSRVAPTHSWSNPAERVMSPLNLAMQNMALAREKLDEDFEAAMRRYNGMSTMRSLGNDDDGEATPEQPLVADVDRHIERQTACTLSEDSEPRVLELINCDEVGQSCSPEGLDIAQPLARQPVVEQDNDEGLDPAQPPALQPIFEWDSHEGLDPAHPPEQQPFVELDIDEGLDLAQPPAPQPVVELDIDEGLDPAQPVGLR